MKTATFASVLGASAARLAAAIGLTGICIVLASCGSQAPQDSSAAETSGSSPAAAQPAPGQASLDFAAEEADLDAGARFAASQTYRDTTYVGDVRTNGGPKPVMAVPDVQQVPAEAELFLFADGCYYYVDPFFGNGSAPIGLHKLDLETGEETVLADDVMSGSVLFYSDDMIFYESIRDGVPGFGAVSADGGKSVALFEGETEGLAQPLGAQDGIAYAICSAYDTPAYVIAATMEDGAFYNTFDIPSEGYAALICGDAILVTDGSTIRSLGLNDLAERWSCTVPGQPNISRNAVLDGTTLYFICNGAGTSICSLDLKTGDLQSFDPGIKNVIQLMLAKDGTLYYCGTESDDISTVMGGDFHTYQMTLSDASVVDLDGSAAPAEAAQPEAADAHDELDQASAADEDATIVTSEFSVTIPEYWRGKVTWTSGTNQSGYEEVRIYPIDRPELDEHGDPLYTLVTVSGVSPDWPENAGDVGGGCVARVREGDKRVEVWQVNWTFMSWQHHEAGSPIQSKYDADALDELVDLSTYGKLGYDDCTTEDIAPESYYCNSDAFANAVTIL